MEGETARMVTKNLIDIMATKSAALKSEQKVYIVHNEGIYKHEKSMTVMNMCVLHCLLCKACFMVHVVVKNNNLYLEYSASN